MKRIEAINRHAVKTEAAELVEQFGVEDAAEECEANVRYYAQHLAIELLKLQDVYEDNEKPMVLIPIVEHVADSLDDLDLVKGEVFKGLPMPALHC